MLGVGREQIGRGLGDEQQRKGGAMDGGNIVIAGICLEHILHMDRTGVCVEYFGATIGRSWYQA